MKYILIIAAVFSQLTVNSYSGTAGDVEGRYTVGKTSCTIEWDTNERAYKVYWTEGIGHTILFFKEEQPNGNMVYDEYESDGSTYAGTFTFKDASYRKGEYERKDGKKFNVKRR